MNCLCFFAFPFVILMQQLLFFKFYSVILEIFCYCLFCLFEPSFCLELRVLCGEFTLSITFWITFAVYWWFYITVLVDSSVGFFSCNFAILCQIYITIPDTCIFISWVTFREDQMYVQVCPSLIPVNCPLVLFSVPAI